MSKFVAAASMAAVPMVAGVTRDEANWAVMNDGEALIGTSVFNGSETSVQTSSYLSQRSKLFLGQGKYDKTQAFRLPDWKLSEDGVENAVVLMWKSEDEVKCNAHRQADLVAGYLGDIIDETNEATTDRSELRSIFQGKTGPQQKSIIVLGCENPNTDSLDKAAAEFHSEQDEKLKFYDAMMWNSGELSTSTDAQTLTQLKSHAHRASFLAVYDMAWRHGVAALDLVAVKTCLKKAIGETWVRENTLNCRDGNGAEVDSSNFANLGSANAVCNEHVGTSVANAAGNACSVDVNEQCFGRFDHLYVPTGSEAANETFSLYDEDVEAAHFAYAVYAMIRSHQPTGADFTQDFADGTGSTSQIQANTSGTLSARMTALANGCPEIHAALSPISGAVTAVSDNYAPKSANDAFITIPVAGPNAMPTVDAQCPAQEPQIVQFDTLKLECKVADSTASASASTGSSTTTSNSAGRALTSVGAAVLGVAALAGAALF